MNHRLPITDYDYRTGVLAGAQNPDTGSLFSVLCSSVFRTPHSAIRAKRATPLHRVGDDYGRIEDGSNGVCPPDTGALCNRFAVFGI